MIVGGNVMKRAARISEAELEIIKVLWRIGESTSSEIVVNLKDVYSAAMVHTLLRRLVTKGFVYEDKTNYYHKFGAIMPQEEYIQQKTHDFVQRVCQGSLTRFLDGYFASTKTRDKDKTELEVFLKALKKR